MVIEVMDSMVFENKRIMLGSMETFTIDTNSRIDKFEFNTLASHILMKA